MPEIILIASSYFRQEGIGNGGDFASVDIYIGGKSGSKYQRGIIIISGNPRGIPGEFIYAGDTAALRHYLEVDAGGSCNPVEDSNRMAFAWRNSENCHDEITVCIMMAKVRKSPLFPDSQRAGTGIRKHEIRKRSFCRILVWVENGDRRFQDLASRFCGMALFFHFSQQRPGDQRSFRHTESLLGG